MSQLLPIRPDGPPAGLPIPTGPIGLAGIAGLAQAWSDALVSADEKRALEAGKSISCRKGCGTCCRQWIPVSPAEAFLLHDLLASVGERRQATLRKRFERVRREVMARAAEMGETWLDPDRYYRLYLACPFLERESCSIHPSRPVACREQLVLSPAANCETFPSLTIQTLDMSHPVSEALLRLCAELLGGAPLRIPLLLAPDWAMEHADLGERRWDGEEVARALAAQLFFR